MADTTPLVFNFFMRLLASVISEREAACVLEFADVIDVKDPAIGPLGAPDPVTLLKIKKITGLTKLLSVALGDAGSDIKNKLTLAEKMVLGGADILKIAVSSLSSKEAVTNLKALRCLIPPSVKVVAVAYADDSKACVTPFDLPDVASQARVDGILIDTCHKNGRSVFDSLSVDELGVIIGKAQKLGLMTALAGSLGLNHIKHAVAIGPDFIGVRSAITKNGNRGEEGVDIASVQLIKSEILKVSATTCSV